MFELFVSSRDDDEPVFAFFHWRQLETDGSEGNRRRDKHCGQSFTGRVYGFAKPPPLHNLRDAHHGVGSGRLGIGPLLMIDTGDVL